MFAYRHNNSGFNNVLWTIQACPDAMWICQVLDTPPLLDGSNPWNKDLKFVGIAVKYVDVKYVDKSEYLDSMIVFQNTVEDFQLQNEWVFTHTHKQVHRRLHHVAQRKMTRGFHTQLKQPDKRR